MIEAMQCRVSGPFGGKGFTGLPLETFFVRTVHLTTGGGWEAEGLRQDVEVPAIEALDAALEWLNRPAGGASR